MGKIYQALEKSNTKDSERTLQSEHHLPADPKVHISQDISASEQDSVPKKVASGMEDRSKGKSKNRTTPADSLKYFDDPSLVIPDYIDKSLISLHTPTGIESEQFRQLKNNILFPEKGMPPKNIMVTSPSPSEGKTFVSANLAATIAQSIDEYVLLIDCDLRSPKIHTLFGLNNPPGLSEYLSQAKPLSSLLVKTFLGKLTILPSGAIPPNPSELLSSEQMRRLLTEVKSRYKDRYIIIDTPPPYFTSETNVLARQVDGIILVVRQGKTRKKEIQNIIDIYGKEKIIGVVQNFAQKKPGYGYGYHKYGYAYGK